MKKYLPHFIATIILLVPVFVLAFGPGPTIDNPLGSDDVNVLLGKIMKLVATVGGIVVVFFIIYSGYKFVTARGNEAEVSKAKDIFYATIIGAAILLGAGIIAQIVVNTVKETAGVN
jgi:lysylphosphatidylglycerol synthetase-like protein (DUF2156 family)